MDKNVIAQLEFQREVAAFDEKITLAELEAAKADERVKELKYQKSRYHLDVIVSNLRSLQKQQEEQQNQQPEE